VSWNKRQFKEAYNRAGEKHEVVAEDSKKDFYDLYDYYDDMYYNDGQHPTMEDLMTGRLLTLLSKLKIRGTEAALTELYW
jgi:hypothetical protein